MKRSDRVRIKADPRVLAIILGLTDNQGAMIAYLDEASGEDEVDLEELELMPKDGDLVSSEGREDRGVVIKIQSHYEASVVWIGDTAVKKINWDRLRSRS